jgi:hypothetical protein
MTDLHRRAILGRIMIGAFVAAAGAPLRPGDVEAAPISGAIPNSSLLDLPVEKAAVRTTCWWRHGRRVCRRRPARRVCWWRGGRRICSWR